MADLKKGFVKTYRSYQDSALWNDGEPFDRRSAFLDLTMMANIEEKELVLHGKTIKIKRGQLHTSLSHLAHRWHWSINRTRRFLALLSELDMAHYVSTPYGTTLTIVNYGKFQDGRHTNEQANEYANEQADEQTDEYANEYTGGTRLKNIKNTRSKKKEKKEAAPQSFYSHMPGWHIQDGWELWKDENGSWHRALIGQKED